MEIGTDSINKRGKSLRRCPVWKRSKIVLDEHSSLGALTSAVGVSSKEDEDDDVLLLCSLSLILQTSNKEQHQLPIGCESSQRY